MQLGLIDWIQVGFLIKYIHENFEIFVLNSKVEIPNQHNIFVFIGHVSQRKLGGVLKKILNL